MNAAAYKSMRLSDDDTTYWVRHDIERGLISVEHDGAITWDELQEIKNDLWGPDACAIEIYPPSDRVVNNLNMRHLWLLGATDWWPDLGHEGPLEPATLRSRFEATINDNYGRAL